MASRLQLQTEFENILGTKNVYFNPPSSVSMNYEAIRYKLSTIQSNFANNSIYKRMKAYDVTLITYDPESEFVDKILALPYCSFNTSYVADNLYHFTFKLYY